MPNVNLRQYFAILNQPTHSLLGLFNQKVIIKILLTHILQITLESGPLTLASEFYTAQEMDSFKKPRKKKRRLKKKNLVDELVAMQSKSKGKQDHGSRYLMMVMGNDDRVMMEDDDGDDSGDER